MQRCDTRYFAVAEMSCVFLQTTEVYEQMKPCKPATETGLPVSGAL